MNNDLISREALKEEIRQEVIENRVGVFVAKRIINLIDNAPTVDFIISPEYVTELQNINKGLIKQLEDTERPQGEEWIDYDNTFYKCPECGYLLEKCCPVCQTKVILPKGGEEK